MRAAITRGVSASLLTIVAIVTLLITAAGAIGGSWKISRNTQAVSIYRENAKAWQDKAELHEERIRELEAGSAAKDTQITGLKAKLAQLEDMVTGRSLLEQLIRDVNAQTSETMAQMGDIRGDLRANSEALSSIASSVASIARQITTEAGE